MKKSTIILSLLCLTAYGSSAQCPAGQVEVQIDVTTDNWGYEVYWQLVDGGNVCGMSPIFIGGNTAELSCGAGTATAGNGYADNTTISEGPWCLTEGADYDIEARDDYGDGGSVFTVNIASYPVYSFIATSSQDEFKFTANTPPALDGQMLSIETVTYVELGNIDVEGDIKNVGQTNITSLDLNYSIDNGATVTETITGLNITPFSTYMYSHGTPWSPSSAGTYSLKVWFSNVNGLGNDDDITNDYMTKSITVMGPIPNIITSYTTDTITLTHEIVGTASSDQISMPQDLDFHPSGELWVVNRGTATSGGSTVTFTDPGGTGQSSLFRKDQSSKHFMNQPTGIAFSTNGNFSTSPGVYDANFDGDDPFTGPALWSSDPAVYAQPSGGNGSHLDMLHETSFGMGIANETGNVFWVFDGNNNDIVRYDFAADHGPGNADHDDGKVRRFTGMSVSRINDTIGSHMELDKNTGWLYIVDNGNQRVLRLDINSGTLGGTPTYGPYETLAEYKNVDGATWEVVVSTGLVEPSGIDVIGDNMIVTDHSTGEIIIYDISTLPATELKRITTGEPGIMGTVIGPEGRIWYVNYLLNKLVKIEPSSILNNAPVAVDDVVSVAEGSTIVIDVQSNDFDNDPLTTTILSVPSNGTYNILNSDSISYTANAGFLGIDTITYSVCDNGSPVMCDNALVIITVAVSVGVSDINDLNTYRIFPNPANGLVYIEMCGNSGQTVELTIMDMLGKSVYNSKFGGKGKMIDVSHFENGIYYIVLNSSTERTARKLIVSH